MTKPIKEGYELVGYAVKGDPTREAGPWRKMYATGPVASEYTSTFPSSERVIWPEDQARKAVEYGQGSFAPGRKLVRVVRKKASPATPSFEGWAVRRAETCAVRLEDDAAPGKAA